MSCLKNPKTFLWFNYYGEHDYKPIKVGKFMVGVSNTFIVLFQCSQCGCKDKRSFITWDELLEFGFTNEEIETFSKIEY